MATKTLTYVACITFTLDSMTLEPCSHISPWVFHKYLKVHIQNLTSSFVPHSPAASTSFFYRIAYMPFFFIRLHWGKSGNDSFFKKIIYLWLCWVFAAVCRVFFSCSKQGLLSMLLIAVASLVVEHRL